MFNYMPVFLLKNRYSKCRILRHVGLLNRITKFFVTKSVSAAIFEIMALSMLVSRPRPFRVTWRYRSRDRLTRDTLFPIGALLQPSLVVIRVYVQWCSGKFGAGGRPGVWERSSQRCPGADPLVGWSGRLKLKAFLFFGYPKRGAIFHLTSKFRKLHKPHIFQVTSD